MTRNITAIVVSSIKRSRLAAAGLAVTLLSASGARADLITFENITGNHPSSAAAGEAQLSAELELVPGEDDAVRFCFFNHGPVASSVKDIHFEDDLALLAELTAISGTGVRFSEEDRAGNLPGGQPIGFDADTSLSAHSPAPSWGLNPGDVLYLSFGLSAGADLDAVRAAIASGDLRIGLHVIAYPNGKSESFVSVPGGAAPPPQAVTEPSLVVVMGLGLVAMGALRRTRS